MLGQYVNNYEIIGLLGEGGMGAVYAAQHRLIGRKVAIKVLKRDLAGEPEVVQRFFNEARAIGAIKHPNIIEIIDVGKLGTVPYLVMELLHGESLSERVARVGPLPFDVAVDFVSQAACALEVAHESGVVHRDLKPENLFIVTQDGRHETIKVLDFGIAKLRDDLTATPVRTRAGSLLGTPLYMSPEQCRGLDELDLRTDVYSLGVILYEAVCGAPPFLAKSIGEVMRMHMFDAPELPSQKRSDVPAQVEHVISKCLAKSPDERFCDMRKLLEALEASGLATTEPDTPVSSLHRSGYARHAPSSLSPVAVAATLRRDQQHTSRPLRLGGARSGSVHFAVWAVVLSLVALGVPDQRLPRHRWGMPMEASMLQLPAAVVIAPLRMAAAVVGVADAPAVAERGLEAPAQEHGAVAMARVRSVGATAQERSSEASARERSAGPLLQAQGSTARPATAGQSNKLARTQTNPTLEPIAENTAPEGQRGMQAAERSGPPPLQPSAAGPRGEGLALQPGYLSLDSAPWAEVFLGDRPLGTTPLIRVPLSPGRHQLTLRNSELDASTTYVVEIKSGQSLARLVGWGR